jgi:hypothetical protein
VSAYNENSILNRKIIEEYYSGYRKENINFNQDVINSTGLDLNDCIIKAGTAKLKCILFNLSMENALVIVKLPDALSRQQFSKNAKVQLRLSFKTVKTLSFNLECSVKDASAYSGSADDFYFLNLIFRKKASDDLIFLIGSFIAKQKDTEKRIFSRIKLDLDIIKELGLDNSEAVLFCDGSARKCIINEISILSGKIALQGSISEYMNKRVMLLIKSSRINETGEMVGNVISCENISGSRGLVNLVVYFDQELMPPLYKMFIGRYIEEHAADRRLT